MACDSTLRLFSANVRGLRSKLKRKSVCLHISERENMTLFVCRKHTSLKMSVNDGKKSGVGDRSIMSVPTTALVK